MWIDWLNKSPLTLAPSIKSYNMRKACGFSHIAEPDPRIQYKMIINPQGLYSPNYEEEVEDFLPRINRTMIIMTVIAIINIDRKKRSHADRRT